MNAPLVSIIIHAYNAVDTIIETYYSIKSQTFSNLEWIVVKDCSKGNTKDIVLKLAKKDKRVLLYDAQKNGGAAVARNFGIMEAKGRFIAITNEKYSLNFSIKKCASEYLNIFQRNF